MVNITQSLQQHLTRYEIKDRLGSGGMATVFRATDLNLDRDVAIKVMHEHLGHDETFKERFEQEARFIAAFNHPNIVQVYDFDTISTPDGEVYFMVMPMLGDETLVDILESCRLKNATLPHERIKTIIGDLANALDYAHARGMVHRDIKPANILFDENNRAILTDFGIARLAEKSNLTADGTIIGTPAYMSPEQATGGETDYRSDIYALGIILFELLTGRPPFDDESTVSVLLKHAQTQPPLVSEYLGTVNPILDAVLNKVLAKDPNERYQSARALNIALEEAVNNESHNERFMPSPIAYEQKKSSVERLSDAGTVVINDTLAGQAAVPKRKNNDKGTNTFSTLVIEPAKQNPLGFAAIAGTIIALLLVGRLTLQQSQAPATPTAVIEENIAVDSMAGIDMVGDAAFFTGDFSDGDGVNEYWNISDTPSIERTIADGVLRINNSQASQAITTLFDPTHFIYDDVNIYFEGRVLASSASPSSALGIVFRYQDADNYNVFAVDGMGRYSIWRRENGAWCELRTACNGGDADSDWEVNDVINPIGEANTLNLNVYENQITGYVNGEQVFMMDEVAFERGAIGIYMASTSRGNADVEIDDFDVTLGMAPSADSMTGDG